MKHPRNPLFAAMLCYACPKSSVAQVDIRNTYPPNSGNGRVGIGPAVINMGTGKLVPSPDDLLHVHGWLPLQTGADCNLYREAAFRISLEWDGNFHPTTVTPTFPCAAFGVATVSYGFGQLSIQNNTTLTSPNTPCVRYSSFANPYDFILSTGAPQFRIYDPLHPANRDPAMPYNFDLLVTNKNPLGSIRFGTTPFGTPEWVVGDLERMTITNIGNVGIGTPYPYSADLLNIHYVLPSGDNPANAPYPAIKLSLYNSAPSPSQDPNVAYYHSLTLALSPADGDFGVNKCDACINVTCGDLVIGTTKAQSDSWAFLNPNTNGGAIRFKTTPSATSPRTALERMTIQNDGTVLIGTNGFSVTAPSSPSLHDTLKLAVNGAIFALEALVKSDCCWPWPDFVLGENYELMPLDKLEQKIKEDKHLPDMQTADQVSKEGINLGEMQAKLLQKIEELTLYVIDLKKENERLTKRVETLERK